MFDQAKSTRSEFVRNPGEGFVRNPGTGLLFRQYRELVGRKDLFIKLLEKSDYNAFLVRCDNEGTFLLGAFDVESAEEATSWFARERRVLMGSPG